MLVLTRLWNIKPTRNLNKFKDFQKKWKIFKKSLKKVLTKSLRCVIVIMRLNKAGVRTVSSFRTIYILIGTMVRKQMNKQLWIKFLSIPSFLNNEISQAIEQGNLQRLLFITSVIFIIPFFVEFDPGSGQTLAACFKHASRTEVRFSTEHFYMRCSVENLPLVADGWVTRE